MAVSILISSLFVKGLMICHGMRQRLLFVEVSRVSFILIHWVAFYKFHMQSRLYCFVAGFSRYSKIHINAQNRKLIHALKKKSLVIIIKPK